MGRDELRSKIKDIKDLPTLPLVVTRILQLVSDQESSVDDAANLIRTDHAIAAKILKVVNTAFYGFPKRITTISQAVVILGFNPIKHLLLSVSVFDLFRDKNNDRVSFDLKKFWGHSLGTAVASEMIAKTTGYPQPEEAFLAGLLHDLGKIILCLYLPDEFSQALDTVLKQELYFYQAEKKVFETDHGLIGKWVADKWNLPPLLVSAIRNHHQTPTFIKKLEPASAQLTAIVKIADGIIKREDIGFSGDYRIPAKEPELLDFIGLSDSDYDQVFIKLKEGIQKAAEVLNISNQELPDYTVSIQQANIELGEINLSLEQANIALTQRLTELSALHEIGFEWHKQRGLHDTLTMICRKIHEVLGFDRVLLGRYQKNTKTLEFQLLLGQNCPQPFSLGVTADSVFSHIFTTKKSVNLEDVERSEYAGEDFFRRIKSHACAIFPIIANQEIVGVIVVDNQKNDKTINSDNIKSLETFVNHAGAAFERDDLIHSLEIANNELTDANNELKNKVLNLTALKNYNQLIIESMTNGIITINKDLLIIVSNPACEDILGLKRGEIMGKKIDTIMSLKNLTTILKQTINDGKPFVRHEIKLVRPDNQQELTLGISTAPLKDKDQKKIVGAISIFRDLTKLKQLQASLRRRDKLSALGEMAAALAHEIRNPLNPIKGFAQLMEREIPADDPRREYTRIIIHEVDRLRLMLTHFLEFTHSKELYLESVDINHLVSETLLLISNQEGTSVIMFGTELAEDLPPALVDENYLKQVMLNIIQNATDVLLESKGEGSEIIIRTRKLNDQYLVIEVADNGPGITAENQSRLFEPFFTTKKNGTGLGLSTCYRIIEDHQGELTFKSEPGQGATFIIKLPLARE